MNALSAFLGSLELAAPIAFADATLVPILSPHPADLDVELLEEGVRAGHTVIREVGLDGKVNEIAVEHRGLRMLLLVDGEQIVGAKQNRVVNASFLVPAGETTVIPVSCVERGRWEYRSATFDASETTMAPSLRGRKLTRVTESVRSERGYDADQGEVWRDVANFLTNSRTRSPTAAYDDGLDRAGIERRLDELRPIARQVGLALVREKRVTLLEVFGAPSLFGRAWRKIARGLLAEVRGDRRRDGAEALLLVRHALDTLASLPQTTRPAPGCGESIHAAAGGLTLGAIAREGVVFHVVSAAA